MTMLCFRRQRSVLGILLALAMILTVWPEAGFQSQASEQETQAGSILRQEGTYAQYMETHAEASYPERDILLPLENYTVNSGEASLEENVYGYDGPVIQTTEDCVVEWNVSVPEAGLYNIFVDYYPTPGRGDSIERELSINGEVPFSSAANLVFQRRWANETGDGDFEKDNQGNERQPLQIEDPAWMSCYLEDYLGYYNGPLYFYFEEGENTITLSSVKEPMAIREIRIGQAYETEPYADVLAQWKQAGIQEAEGYVKTYQAEKARYKSDASLYPIYDRSSPLTEPYGGSKITLNSIGGTRWQSAGQSLTWEITVPEDGLYTLDLKFRQNVTRGLLSHRKLLIDGQVPFKEMEDITFSYKTNWQIETLGHDGEPYLFYFTAGKTHTITLEVTLGDMASIIQRVQDHIYALNTATRKIVMITGSTPDVDRDYQIEDTIPDVVESLGQLSNELKTVSAELYSLAGKRGSDLAVIDQLAYQLSDFYEEPYTIPLRLSSFKDNVAALGTWALNAQNQPLELDYLRVSSIGQELPKSNPNFFESLIHGVRMFLDSFTSDYNMVGNIYNADEAITVWLSTGRDQAQVLKSMVDDAGLSVNLQLVQPGTILPAILAKIGPDVYLQAGVSEPVNYASRNAVVDLTQFSTFAEVEKRFYSSALVPYRFRTGVYALPEQQTFPIMFYRKDIFEELQIEPPRTWDELYTDVLPVLQKNSMNFGVPVSTTTDVNPGMVTFNMLLLQNGGELYREDGIASGLDSQEAVKAFTMWTNLYSNYKLPLSYDAANRFRTGEIPLLIADYTLYNTLTVFAPELKGEWGFCPVLGMENEDGTINNAVASTGTACMIFEYSQKQQQAWEFIDWWTDAPQQSRFGKDMESLLGPSAKYPTANIEALQQLSWPTQDFESLSQQMQTVVGIPEVPGGYFTPRHVNNAFRKVTNTFADPRETLLEYVRVINREITAKREEFGLPTQQETQEGGQL